MLFNDKELTKDVSEIVTIEAFQYLVELINRVRLSFIEDKQIFLNYNDGYCYYAETCMEWTRYGNRFYTIPYVYLFFKYYNKKNINELTTEDFVSAFDFTFEVAKFLTVQSVINDQVVYAVHSYVLNNILYELVGENNLKFILENIKRDINKPRWSLNTDINDNYGSQEFFRRIKSGLFWNARRSYIVCCWVDFFIEIYNKTNNVAKLLMDWNNNPFDKEHIYPQDILNDKFKNDNEKLELYNGIGNLTLLERGINREIGADLKKKFERYKESKFFTIQEIQKNAEKAGKKEIIWTEKDIENRNEFVKKMFMQEFGLTE